MDASLLIIGAGPAGLLAAWAAARHNPPGGVLVVDRLAEPGLKLAATGGGRGNLSHQATETEFAAAFGRNGRFAIPAFRSLPPDRLRQVLAGIGVPTVVDPDGRIYPRSQSAVQVREALFRACSAAGVRFEFNHAVERLAPPGSRNDSWRVDAFAARAVLLAAGGRSAPHLGSDGSGFALAAGLGYDHTPLVPALASVHAQETWPGTLSGISLPDAALSIAASREPAVRGEILFTHRGISGPAVLNLSGRIARLRHQGKPVILCLGLLPLKPDFTRLRQSAGTRRVLSWLADFLPRALAGILLDLAGIPADLTFSRLTAGQERELARVLTALPLTVSGTGGFAESMVTSGGVSLKQVRPETLEGRRTPGLYFAGEILDLDGPTGGWNLQWAFCSGHLAGGCAATVAAGGIPPCAPRH